MKTAVITGGNSGMGKVTAMKLAKKGYRVIIHGRDEAKTKAAAEEIRSHSGSSPVEYVIADISLISGMKQFADEVRQKTDSIDTLVLSTGVILPKHVLTADGLEAGFVIQYLSRFAAVQLLMPQLKKSGRAKIVHVGAPVIKGATINFENLALKNEFSMFKGMGQAMFGNHLFVQEFAKRYPGGELVMNIMHVGIAKTGIMRETNFLLRLLVNIVGKSPEKAAENIVYLASDEAVNFSGYFLNKPADHSEKEKIRRDPAIAEKLWNKSMELIKPIG